jgi:hypothetical protein
MLVNMTLLSPMAKFCFYNSHSHVTRAFTILPSQEEIYVSTNSTNYEKCCYERYFQYVIPKEIVLVLSMNNVIMNNVSNEYC